MAQCILNNTLISNSVIRVTSILVIMGILALTVGMVEITIAQGDPTTAERWTDPDSAIKNMLRDEETQFAGLRVRMEVPSPVGLTRRSREVGATAATHQTFLGA